MLAFDLETTGVDPENARIVSACVAVIDGTGFEPPAIREWFVNPGVEIPAEASAIHGITTERACAEGMDPAVAMEEILCALEVDLSMGVPLVIYNAPYDLTLFDRECRRHGVKTLTDDPVIMGEFPVIDPLVLDKHLDKFRKGKRTLEAACQHYGCALDGAHDSTQDALAAARVAWRIAQKYPAIAAMPLDDLHEMQKIAKLAQDISFAEYLTKQAKAAKTQADAFALYERANSIADGHWPLVPYTAAVTA